MTTLREAAQQALEALASCSGVPHWPALQPTIPALRAALEQQAEPEPVAWMCPEDPERETAFNWRPGHCENCGKKRIPLYAALEQKAEPEQEPVAWRYQDARGNYRYRGYVQGFDKEYSRLRPVPLYTAPPQRKPLTDEELDALAIDEDGLPNSHLEFARAIERAHGIGEEE